MTLAASPGEQTSTPAANVVGDDTKRNEFGEYSSLTVFDSKGQERTFGSLLSGQNIPRRQLVVFVRHFFCGNCQQYIRALCSEITPDGLRSLPITTGVTIVGCGQPDLINMYAEATGSEFPIYADPSGKLYDAFGMLKTLNLGPNNPDYVKTGQVSLAIKSAITMVRSGTGAFKGGNVSQVGGEILFEDGKVVWFHRMPNTRGHSEVAELKKQLGFP